jgi:cyclopropane fatty-acyl-phospholipid synthase-like methyltransferase
MSDIHVGNINNSYFDGFYKDVWRAIIPEALTKAEVDYLVNSVGLEVGSSVLDLMCGYGRHTLSLARRGINVTALDNLVDYIIEIRETAEKENLPVTVLHEDVIQFQSEDKYDLVICLGNSVSFFNEADSEKIFLKISSKLKDSGKFIFNSWLITEISVKQFQENSWATVGNVKCLYSSKYLFFPTRIETEATFINTAGITETKKGIDYVYSLNETEALLKRSGLLIKEIWSIPGKKKFTLGEPRIYIVAQRANG